MAENKFRIAIDPQILVPGAAVRKYYFLSLLLTAGMGAAIGILYNKLPLVVPLYLTEPWGEARLAPKIYLSLLPILSFSVMTVNLLVSRTVAPTHKAIVTALALGSLMVSMMMVLSLYGIAQALI
jgi:hypothetical protein